MTKIRGPDGEVYQFPDDMPADAVKAEMAKRFPPSQPSKPVSSVVPESVTAGAGGMLEGVPILGPALYGLGEKAAAGYQNLRYGVPYDKALQVIQQQDPAMQERHPVATTVGNVGGAIAGTAPAVALAPEAFGAGSGGLLYRSLISALTNAGIGGVDAAVRKGADPVEIAKGAGISGGAGLVAPGLGAAAGAVTNAVVRGVTGGVTAAQRAGSTAGRLAGRAVTSDAYTPMTAAMRLNEMGKQGMFADLGPNLTQQTGGLAAIPGKGQKIVRDALETRAKGATSRVTDYLEQGFGKGPANVAQKAQDIIAQRSADARPVWDKALSNPVAWDERLQQFIDDPLVKGGLKQGLEIQRLESLAADVPFDPTDYAITAFNEAGDPIITGVPNMKTLTVIKKGLDKLVENETDAVTGRLNQRGNAVNQVRKAFVSKLDEINPDYKAARAQWEGPTKVHAALLEGQEVFRRTVSPDELQMRLDGMNASEREAYVEGARSQIAEMMGSARNDATAATRELADKGWNREKLSILLGDKPAERLVQGLGLEKTFQATVQRVTQNSETAARQAAQQELGFRPSSFGVKEGLMAGGVMGGVRSAGVKGLEAIANSMRGASKDAVREQLAKLLTATGPERDAAVRQISKALTTQNKTDIISSRAALAAALLQPGARDYRGP